jgi:hypothetical protein
MEGEAIGLESCSVVDFGIRGVEPSEFLYQGHSRV